MSAHSCLVYYNSLFYGETVALRLYGIAMCRRFCPDGNSQADGLGHECLFGSKPNSYIPDSLKQLPSTDRLPADTLRRLATLPSSVQRVYSEKQWNTAADSLLKIPGINIPNPPELPAIKNVSEGELQDAVNQKFFPGPKPALPVNNEQDLMGQVVP